MNCKITFEKNALTFERWSITLSLTKQFGNTKHISKKNDTQNRTYIKSIEQWLTKNL